MAVSNRTCTQCGTLLAPNEIFCSNCGTRYTDPASIEPAQDTSSSSPYQSEPTQYVGTSYSSPTYANASHGGEGQGYAPSPLSNATSASSLPADVGYTSYSSPYAAPLQPLRQSRRGPNIALFIGIGVLVCLLVGGGIFFLALSKGNTASSVTTASGNGTISGTASGALFSDDFADNSKGWDTGSGSGYSSTIGKHAMVLSEANHKILAEPLPGSGSIPATYSDFSITTTFTMMKADQNDSVGLYVRGDDNLSQGYFVDIFGDNTYDIVKVFPNANQDAFLISPTSSSAINSVGQQNKLTVIMKGPKIVVLINDKVVNSISDSAYASGQLAIFAENGRSSDGVKATFSSVSVYPAPPQLPS